MPDAEPTFTRVFLGEVALRTGLTVLAMLLAGGGAAVGDAAGGEWSPFGGAVAGLMLGAGLAVLVLRKRRQSEVATGREGSATHSLQDPG